MGSHGWGFPGLLACATVKTLRRTRQALRVGIAPQDDRGLFCNPLIHFGDDVGIRDRIGRRTASHCAASGCERFAFGSPDAFAISIEKHRTLPRDRLVLPAAAEEGRRAPRGRVAGTREST